MKLEKEEHKRFVQSLPPIPLKGTVVSIQKGTATIEWNIQASRPNIKTLEAWRVKHKTDFKVWSHRSYGALVKLKRFETREKTSHDQEVTYATINPSWGQIVVVSIAAPPVSQHLIVRATIPLGSKSLELLDTFRAERREAEKEAKAKEEAARTEKLSRMTARTREQEDAIVAHAIRILAKRGRVLTIE